MARENEFDGMTREELLDRAMTRGFPHLVGTGSFVSNATVKEPTDVDLAVMVGRSVRLPADLDARLRRVADQLNASVSDLVRRWIAQGVMIAESVPPQPAGALLVEDDRPVRQGGEEPAAVSKRVMPWARQRTSIAIAEKELQSPLVGNERRTLANEMVKLYTSGHSIRTIAAETGRSYGFVHRVLTEAGVQLRVRGGARRRKESS